MLVKNTYRELVQVSFNVADEFKNEAFLIGEFHSRKLSGARVYVEGMRIYDNVRVYDVKVYGREPIVNYLHDVCGEQYQSVADIEKQVAERNQMEYELSLRRYVR